jgi:hypothetical protein
MPETNYFGDDIFTWKAFDGNAWSENTATVRIEINTAPNINTIYKTGIEDEDVHFDASDLANYSLDHTSYIKIVSIPSIGLLLFDPQKTTPDHPFDGSPVPKGHEFYISDLLDGKLVYHSFLI